MRRGRGNRNSTVADDRAEIERAKRRAEIFRLRISEGMTQIQIAEQLGISQSVVSIELARIREEWKPENVDELREIANARLNKIWRSLERQLKDPQAASAAIKAIAEHAKLNGLHAPVKTEVMGSVSLNAASPDEARKIFAEVFGPKVAESLPPKPDGSAG